MWAKTKKKISDRDALVNETFAEIESRLEVANGKLSHVMSELSGWNISKGRLISLIADYGENEEEQALMEVAQKQIDKLEQDRDAVESVIAELKKYQGMAQKAQNAFEIVENTNYLVRRNGIEVVQPSELENFDSIRRAVYGLEGYMEIATLDPNRGSVKS